MPSMHMKIKPDGNVYPCCVGPDSLLMGNTKQQSVEEIWNGEKYREFRRRMFARDYPEACQNCEHLVANPHFEKLPQETTK